jgi:transcription elongation factor Elf1
MKEHARVCPNCGSTDVSVDRSDVVGMLGLDYGYKCGNCGFSSKLFPEVPVEDMGEYQQELQEKNPDAYLQEEYEPTQKEPNRSRALMGGLFILLGAGSVPMVRVSLHGLFGAFLLPVGIYMLYQEWKRFRGTP